MDKTAMLVRERYFWPSINKDIRKFVEFCRVFQLDKGGSQNMGLYTPLLLPENPWEDVNIDFVLGLLRTQRKHDYMMVVVDQFSKMAYFITCKTTSDVTEVVVSFFK